MNIKISTLSAGILTGLIAGGSQLAFAITNTQGQTIYQNQCAGCHGSDPANGSRKIANGVSARAITGQHNFVAPSDADLLAAYIDEVINPPATTPTTPVIDPTTLNGTQLYADNCSGCHGSDPANGSNRIERGVDPQAILNKHSTSIIGGNPTTAEAEASIQAISTYISEQINTPAPTTPTTTTQTGEELYASTCSGCHGSDPSNGRNKIDRGVSASVITGKHGTGYSSTAETALIADYIDSVVNGGTQPTTPTTTPTIPTNSNLIVAEFQDGSLPTTRYRGTEDTYISQNDPTASNGGAATLLIDGSNPSPYDETTLIKWDISSIPINSIVDSVTLTFNITNPTDEAYSVYQAMKAWTESATWNQYAPGSAWTKAGANEFGENSDGTPTTASSPDRGTIVAQINGNSTGIQVIDLNSQGVDLVQQWINGNQTNHGFIIADTNISNGLDLSSSESSTTVNRPMLTIRYTVGSSTGSSTGSTTTPPTTTTTPDTTTGAELYAQQCSGCHGSDPAQGQNKIDRGTSSSVITGKHSFVTNADADLISGYIASATGTTTTTTTTTTETTSTPSTGATPTTGGTVTSSNGAQLYAEQCAVCHGANPANGDNNVDRGTSANVIMNKHGFVIQEDATEIATYINDTLSNASSGGTSTGTGSSNAEGAQLYADLCSTCHGADPGYNYRGIRAAADSSRPVTQHYFVNQSDADLIAPYVSERIAVIDSKVDTVISEASSGGALSPLWLMLTGLLGFRRRK